MSAPLVRIDYRKWPEDLHWQMHLEALGEDEHGVWFHGPPGTTAARASEPPVVFGHGWLLLVPRDASWTAMFNAPPHDVAIYVDITTPAEIADGHVRMIDLDLDVIRYRDGRVIVDDEDEFAEHQVSRSYPSEIIATARETCDMIERMVRAGDEPFGDASAPWFEAVANR